MGRDRFEVRDEIEGALKEAGNLVKVENYKNKVGFQNVQMVIEPRLEHPVVPRMRNLQALFTQC